MGRKTKIASRRPRWGEKWGANVSEVGTDKRRQDTGTITACEATRTAADFALQESFRKLLTKGGPSRVSKRAGRSVGG